MIYKQAKRGSAESVGFLTPEYFHLASTLQFGVPFTFYLNSADPNAYVYRLFPLNSKLFVFPGTCNPYMSNSWRQCPVATAKAKKSLKSSLYSAISCC